MQEPSLRATIVSIEAKNASTAEWIALPDLIAVKDKAETIVTADNALNSPHRNTNPSSTAGSSTNQSAEEALRKRSVEIKAALYTATTAGRTNVLRNFAIRYQGGCYLHKSHDHQFFECRKLKKLCSKLNCTQHLQEAAENPEIQRREQEPPTRSQNTRSNGTRASTRPSNQTAPTGNQMAVAPRVQRIERREEKLKQQKKEM